MEETMEREGFVSLWVGCAASDVELYKYVSLDYGADEDEEMMSQFLKDFRIPLDDFDEDYIESVCFDEPKTSIAEMADTLNGESLTNRIGDKTLCRIHIFYTGFLSVGTEIMRYSIIVKGVDKTRALWYNREKAERWSKI